MYSAENSSSSYPLSYHQLSPSFTISENTNILLQTQQNHPQTTLHEESFTHLPSSLSTPISAQNPNIMNTMPPNNSSFHSPLDSSFRQENEPNWGCLRDRKKPLTKKDRHTKISTAQGIRDRRVRLSINIAREFFNLQDLLGFDKASKTLGWLLSKSKAAIDELVRASSNAKEEDIKQQELMQGSHQSNISRKKQEKKDLDDDQGNCGDQNSEREARRAKARARARERTKNKKKMMMKIMIPHQDDDDDHHHNFVNQRAHNNLMDQQPCSGATPQNKLIRSSGSSSYNYNCTDHHHHHHQAGFDNNQHNNNNDDYLMKLALEGTPGFSAFNIINLSTEIHINAKPWENRVNQVQY